ASRVAPALAADLQGILWERPLREGVTTSGPHRLIVHRRRALYGSWYEFFPRSEGARFDPQGGGWSSGTLRTAARSLDRIAAMGFDVAYLTPIHPIGTSFRKGRNNSLETQPGDPGSPYAIGSPAGGRVPGPDPGDGLRRRLPDTDPSHRHLVPQGPQQQPGDTARGPRIALRDRLPGRRP